MRGFYVRADFASIARIDATVAYLARVLQSMGDTTNLDTRRAKAVLIMANPTQAVKILHAYAAYQRQTDPPANLWRGGSRRLPNGSTPPWPPSCSTTQSCCRACGCSPTSLTERPTVRSAGSKDAAPVTAEWVRKHLGYRCRFKITPVLDPLDQAPVDAWEIPNRHRQAVK